MVATPAAIALDSYVLDVLMRDLVGHDKKPSAFIVYLYLAARIEREMTHCVEASYATIASATGLSKSAVQHAISHLKKRRLVIVSRDSPTSNPQYRLHRHWRLRLRGA
jgi:DNA-binding transcriptional ArsR family regulator